MNEATLQFFSQISDAMQNSPTNWQWIGRWESEQMFGITEKRAREYQKRYGGEARPMT